MIRKLIRLILGDKQTRDMKRIMPLVDEINEVAKEFEKLSDEELQNKTCEFRRLLHVVPRLSTVRGEVVDHERAEELLKTHPDVENCIFLGTRRDNHDAELVVFVIARDGARKDADLTSQIREGMGRLGPAYKPANVVFLDKFPHKEGEEKTLDFHQLMLVIEEFEFEPWEERTWAELKSEIPSVNAAPVSLDDLLPDAFAAVKEACRRHVGKSWDAAGAHIDWNIMPFDVQLAGGIALHEGNIAEMATGEGKTMVAVAPLYLNGLSGGGAHLITVNDYLARRDSEWMGPIYKFLGLTVGCIDKHDPHMQSDQRRLAYRADVTYGTNNEFGFDYLRDNMATRKELLLQRGHNFAIIDEVDSVLIDEARTPLIISGPVDRSNHHYIELLEPVRELVQKQTMLVNRYVKEAQDLLDKDPDSYEAGRKLYQISKAMPRHNRYMKLLEDARTQKLQQRTEASLMLEGKGIGKGTSAGIRDAEEELFFVVDDKNRNITLTDKGRASLSPKDPDYFVLPDLVDEFARIDQRADLEQADRDKLKLEARTNYEQKADSIHSISQLLHAFTLKTRDVDYVVEEGKIVIVDENTGRKMTGRRWSDGLHAAVEAKEGVKIEKETQTLATITIQNYFRLYKKLSGMTGTAETEAAEFAHTYDMDVVVVPTNVPCQRKDLHDEIYKTEREKFAAVVDEVERLHKMSLPILIGTASIQTSEKVSRMLKARKLTHEVLNAKNHAREAEIVALAGQPGAITVATNMAGRGTDIKLGPGVKEPRKDDDGNEWLGGLQIVGTERHESRRIDRQLRGRAGRQGDPGTSRFFVSLEDQLMQWFGGERLVGLMTRMGLQDGEAISHPLVTRSVENAQKKVEGINHERRKRTLEYDDVMNKQRGTIYGLRREVLMEPDLRETMLNIFAQAVEGEFNTGNYGNPEDPAAWDTNKFFDWVARILFTSDLSDLRQMKFNDFDQLFEAVMDKVVEAYDTKEELLGSQMTNALARFISLRTIDVEWQDHLLAIDSLREGVSLRSYGQREPLLEFTRDATSLFNEMLLAVQKEVFDRFFRAQIAAPNQEQRVARVQYSKPEAGSAVAPAPQQQAAPAAAAPVRERAQLTTYRRDVPKVGRNEPCPCGSGKKYKDCHGSPAMRESREHVVPGGAEEEET